MLTTLLGLMIFIMILRMRAVVLVIVLNTMMMFLMSCLSFPAGIACGSCALFSCGTILDYVYAARDGTVAEYDVDKPSQTRGLRLLSLHHLAGPTALSPGPIPTALAFAPPLPYFAQGSSDTLLLVADEAYKLRMYNTDTHMCVSTAVGPLHGGPINSCRVFRSDAICGVNPSAWHALPPFTLPSVSQCTPNVHLPSAYPSLHSNS